MDEAPTLNKVAELRCVQSYEEMEDRNEIEDMRVTVKIVRTELVRIVEERGTDTIASTSAGEVHSGQGSHFK